MKSQKEVSTMIGAIIIVAAAFIFFSGVVVYQNIQFEKIISLFSETSFSASLPK